MALTGRIVFSSYPYSGNGHQLDGKMGTTQNLPSALVKFYTAPPNTVAGNNVSIKSIVELLPNGLNQKGQRFYTDSTTTALASNGS